MPELVVLLLDVIVPLFLSFSYFRDPLFSLFFMFGISRGGEVISPLAPGRHPRLGLIACAV